MKFFLGQLLDLLRNYFRSEIFRFQARQSKNYEAYTAYMLNNFCKAVAEIWKLQPKDNYAVGLLIEKKKCYCSKTYLQMGFSLIEMLVSTAIIIFISGQVLVSFSALRESSTLNRAAQELSFNIRRAQNMSLSVVAVGIGGIIQIPRAIGLRLSYQSGSNTTYFFFADQDGNRIYSGAIERIEPNIILPGNIKITAVTGELPAAPGAHIIFYTPEATLILSNGGGGIISNFMDVTLTAPSGATRIVRIRVSGQVTVR